MPVHPLYRDFFRFLVGLDGSDDPWLCYRLSYFDPHREFLEAYWGTFVSMDLEQVEARVRRIRRGDYANLEGLVAHCPPERLVEEALARCRRVAEAPEPDVYLIVGFFSSDGFVMHFRGQPVIGVGLERFRDFRPVGVVVSHEYCHYLRRLAVGPGPERTVGQVLLSEGLASAFSKLVYPERPLYQHLFLPRERFNWCVRNEERLLAIAKAEAPRPLSESVLVTGGREDIPPRAANYVGYALVEAYLRRHGSSAIGDLVGLADVRELGEVANRRG